MRRSSWRARPARTLDARRAVPFPRLSADLIRKLDTPGPRYTSYPTVPEWSELSADTVETHLDRLAGAGPLSLYLHLPFCRERCTFCGCNVVVTKTQARADDYLDAVETEVGLVADRWGSRKPLSQLHWGGGTPTFLDVPQLERAWRVLERRFTLTADAEVSIEIDPVVTTEEQIRILRRLGFNRISLGVQDFDPKVQEGINRLQSVEETRRLTDLARALGYRSVNFDLIYGLPHQTPESWSETLERVVELRPDRLAVYSFAFVPQLRPHQKRLAVAMLPTGVTKLELFRRAYEAFENAGYQVIGLDHFALPDDELARASRSRRLGRNFMGHTVHAADDVVAFGVTAIGDVAGLYVQNHPQMAKYRQALADGRLPIARGAVRSTDDDRRRDLIRSLLSNGWANLGPDAERYFETELSALEPLEADGLVHRRGTELELTDVGRLFARNVAMVFDRYLRARDGRGSFSRTV